MKNRPAVVLVVGLLSWASLSACDAAASDDRAGADVARGSDATGVLDGGVGPPTGARPLADGADLSGTWAMLNVHTATVDLPVVGATTVRTTGRFLVVVAQDGRDLTLAVTVCSLAIDNGTDLVATIVPDAFVRSLPVAERPAQLEPVDGGLRLVQPRWYDVRGVRLDDPASEALPTEPADPRVWDQDGDGNPGITLQVTGVVDGAVYVAQRASEVLTGVDHTESTLDGFVAWTDEQVVLGADNVLLEVDQLARPAAADESFFLMTRMDEGADCERILADGNARFAR